jgi:hypothetical protein
MSRESGGLQLTETSFSRCRAKKFLKKIIVAAAARALGAALFTGSFKSLTLLKQHDRVDSEHRRPCICAGAGL